MASHPTPPLFDGTERRNFWRNADEIGFWSHYLSCPEDQRIYDDQGRRGGFGGQRFVVLGDLNASHGEGLADDDSINGLLQHPRIQNQGIPASEGGLQARPDNPFSPYHTADWGLRADYVLPGLQGIKVIDNAVHWPVDLNNLRREDYSDHRLVWLDIALSD